MTVPAQPQLPLGGSAGDTPPPPPPPEIKQTPSDPPSPPPPPPETPPAPPEPIDPEDASDGVTAEGESVRVPTAKFKTIKDKAKAKGKREADAAMLATALSLGFSNVEEMIAAAKTQRETPKMTTTDTTAGTPGTPAPGAPAGGAPAGAAPPPPAPPAPPPAPPAAPPAADRALSADARERIRKEADARKEAEAAAAKAKADAVAAQKAADAQIAESQKLHMIGYDMVRQGVDDPQYALHLYKTHRDGLDEAGKAKLDAAAVAASADGKTPAQPSGLETWLAELKKSKPALFKAQAAPITTGPVTGPAKTPPPPGPAQVTGASGDGAKVDVTKMSPEEYQKWCKERGINPKA